MECKYEGIDCRIIKCCDKEKGTIEGGISFDQDNDIDILRFHFLDYLKTNTGLIFLIQETKTMHLNKENKMQLIKHLQDLL